MLNKFKPANTPIGNWHDGLAALCLACLILILTVLAATNEYAFVQGAAHAKGVVTRQNHGKHHVDIKFTAASGEVVEYTQNGFVSYEVGEEVAVLYDPKDPDQLSSADAIGALWVWTIGLSILTLGALIVSMGSIFLPKYFTGPFSRNSKEG